MTSASEDKVNCRKIVDGLQKPENPSINAVVSLDNCDADLIQFQGELNFEALKFVSNDVIYIQVIHSYILLHICM